MFYLLLIFLLGVLTPVQTALMPMPGQIRYGLLGAGKKSVGPVQYLGLLCVMAGIAVLRLN